LYGSLRRKCERGGEGIGALVNLILVPGKKYSKTGIKKIYGKTPAIV